jgi:hypothetical protein
VEEILMEDIGRENKGGAPARLFEMFRFWAQGWGGKLTFASGVLTLTHLLYLQFHWGGDAYVNIVNDSVSTIIYGGAFLLALKTSRHPALSLRTRRAWLFAALASLGTAVGCALWGYFEVIIHTVPFPSWADPAYLSYYPLMFCASSSPWTPG